MSEAFEDGRAYDAELARGLALSGESKDFFAEGRIAHLRARLRKAAVRRVLDFGCGVGGSSVRLADAFDADEVIGVDVTSAALDVARSRTSDPRVSYATIDELPRLGRFDLCYVNGVFHHLRPEERRPSAGLILDAVVPGGHAAVFENSFWSVPARLVMRRIPFDRDATLIRPAELRGLLAGAGFAEVEPVEYLFVFPRALAALRRVESTLTRLPLGAQCVVLARR